MGFFLHVREDRNIECEPNFQEPKWLGLSIILDKQMTELRTKHEKGQIFYESGTYAWWLRKVFTNKQTHRHTNKQEVYVILFFHSFFAKFTPSYRRVGYVRP